MNGVIVACKDSSMCDKLSQCLASAGVSVLGIATRGASALHIANRIYGSGGVLLCSYAMSDMTASELYKIKPDNFEMVVLLSPRQRAVFRGSGMVCLDIPINRGNLLATLEMLMEQGGVPRSSKPPERTEDEKKIISEAKSLLMERNNMTEPDAHRFMQKRSMDSGEALVEVARKILNGVL